MGRAEAEEAVSDLGEEVEAAIPAFSNEYGAWLSPVTVAQSVWGDAR